MMLNAVNKAHAALSEKINNFVSATQYIAGGISAIAQLATGKAVTDRLTACWNSFDQ